MRGRGPKIIPATEIVAFVDCKEQWRLEYGLSRLARSSPASGFLVGKSECPRDAAAAINRLPGSTPRSPCLTRT